MKTILIIAMLLAGSVRAGLAAAAEGRYEPMNSLVYTQYEFPWGGDTEAFREFKARKGEVRGLQQMVRESDYVALRVRLR